MQLALCRSSVTVRELNSIQAATEWHQPHATGVKPGHMTTEQKVLMRYGT